MRDLWRLLGYLKPYLGRMIAAAVLLAISGALMAAVVATVKPLINDVLLPEVAKVASVEEDSARPPGADILDTVKSWLPSDAWTGWSRDKAFVQVPLLIIAIFFVRGVFLYFGNYWTIRAGASVIRDLRNELYSAVAHQSLEFYHAHPTGLIMSRILYDVTLLKRVTTVVLADLVRVGAMIPFLLITALYHEWRMTLFVVVLLPLVGFPMVKLGKRLRRAATASQEHLAILSSRLTESVTGVKVVQGFGMEQYEIGRFRMAVHRLLRADLKAGRAQALGPAAMELLGASIGAGLFYIAGMYIAKGELDPGNFAVVLFCMNMLFASIRRINSLYADFQTALSAAVRVFDMLDRERAIHDVPEARPLPQFSDALRFDHVDFSYGDEIVLEDIDLTIRKGELIALVGASGAGKSTLANLVPRFYDPTAGRILIDGQDIRSATLVSLREQIGLVTQETVLFDDSVRDNIAYGRSDVPLERVIEVARASQAHGFIESLPQGYDTLLGERGTRLSMGQRQRITIARALLKDPPLLILDEATSALDTESEALVQQALEALLQGRTSIVIAHRLSTVRNADRILVMDAGRIIEQGTHDELLARRGAYARLHDLQFRDLET